MFSLLLSCLGRPGLTGDHRPLQRPEILSRVWLYRMSWRAVEVEEVRHVKLAAGFALGFFCVPFESLDQEPFFPELQLRGVAGPPAKLAGKYVVEVAPVSGYPLYPAL